jgi:hypothetical protein
MWKSKNKMSKPRWVLIDLLKWDPQLLHFVAQGVGVDGQEFACPPGP